MSENNISPEMASSASSGGHMVSLTDVLEPGPRLEHFGAGPLMNIQTFGRDTTSSWEIEQSGSPAEFSRRFCTERKLLTKRNKLFREHDQATTGDCLRLLRGYTVKQTVELNRPHLLGG